MFFTHIIDSMPKLSYISPTWKHSVIIMISIPNKPKHLINSYLRSVYYTDSENFEKLILCRILPLIQLSSTFQTSWTTKSITLNFEDHLYQIFKNDEYIYKIMKRKIPFSQYEIHVSITLSRYFSNILYNSFIV